MHQQYPTLYFPTKAHNVKKVELLKHFKISKTAPTCFGLQGNHHQEATISTLLKITHLVKSTRVGTLIVATIYLQLIQNRNMFRSFTVLHSSHQHCVQPVASDVEVVGYL